MKHYRVAQNLLYKYYKYYNDKSASNCFQEKLITHNNSYIEEASGYDFQREKQGN